ncbi:MAG: L,D-transpeptidase family protein [Chitinophagaceae bacterium]|nr:L,D-transpeptidase family protein [Chitinophagaceae bacterium]
MKYFSSLILILFCALVVNGQTAASVFTFIDYQRSFPRFSDALKRKEDTLMKQFREKKMAWPVKNIYIRSFKYDSKLEVWVKYENEEKYRLFKTYKVCALAGSLGPKRMQGDYQVPEGFYHINEFNPRSTYHLSLGLNYPNPSDRILGDSIQPGGDIYIHGKCVTSGCIPINDQQIEELYILAAHAHSQGQDFIPVHIFPVDFKTQKSTDYLTKYIRQFPEYTYLTNELKQAYIYFEKTKKLPVIMIGTKGEYIVANTHIEPDPEPEPVIKTKSRRPVKEFSEAELAKVVDKLPVYPGGNPAFQKFIDKVSLDMAPYLDRDMKRTYVMIEFIIDKNGKPAYAKVIKGGNDEMNDKLEERFENMPDWAPAIRLDKNVAIKLKQSLEISR